MARRSRITLVMVVLASIIGTVTAVVPAAAATDTVTNCNDSGTGSLRQAVANASAGDTINFAVDCPASAPISLNSEIVFTQNITIDGPGSGSLVVDGNTTTAFYVNGKTITVSGITIENSNSAFYNDMNSGAVDA